MSDEPVFYDYYICSECGRPAVMGPVQTFYCPAHGALFDLNRRPSILYRVRNGRVYWR